MSTDVDNNNDIDFTNKLEETPQKYKEVYNELKENTRIHKDTILASIEYIESDKFQRDIAEKYGVSDTSIALTYRKIAEKMDLDIDNIIGDTGKGKNKFEGEVERISVRLSEKDLKEIDRLVEEGEYKNRSEAIREAIKLLIHKDNDRIKVIQRIDSTLNPKAKTQNNTDLENSKLQIKKVNSIDEGDIP